VHPCRAREYDGAPSALQSRPMSEPLEPRRGLRPGGAVRGSFRAPGSKSIAQRALVIAALADGETRIAGLPAGEDVEHARALLRAAGVEIDALAPAAVRVRGRPPGPHRGWMASRRVEVGESGTLARFALAAFALCGRAGDRVEVEAEASLRARRSDALLDALERTGVAFERREWPIVLRPLGPPSRVELHEPRSSQEASALAIALAAWPDEIELSIRGKVPSRPYLDMTLATLRRFGARVERVGEAGDETLSIRGPLRAPAVPILVEPDASLAAVALAAACLSGGELVASGLGPDSWQGDVAIVEVLRAFGCRARLVQDGIVASGFPQRAVEVDLSAAPDLAPVAAALAAGASLVSREPSLLRGLGTLPGKESSRIEVLAEGLSRAGWPSRASADALAIAPPGSKLAAEPLFLDPGGDHRMAFAFALLGLLRDRLDVRTPDCVAKSWPGFWRDLATLGARVAAVP
jgi:3-phosphoshikimate 1-carboxyvinyltransferase